jgi:hypothetical protein
MRLRVLPGTRRRRVRVIRSSGRGSRGTPRDAGAELRADGAEVAAAGCDYLQGYLMDPALPPATYAAML